MSGLRRPKRTTRSHGGTRGDEPDLIRLDPTDQAEFVPRAPPWFSGEEFRNRRGPVRRVRLAAALVLLLLSGCVATPAHDGAAPRLPDGLALPPAHDHKDPHAHDLAFGLKQVGFMDLQTLFAAEPGRASDVQFFGDLAAVTVNGGAGGFVLVNASDPAHMKVLSRYRSGSEDNWYTKFSPDGKLVFLTANGNFNPQTAASTLAADAQSGTATDAARGLQIIDISDVLHPRLVGVYPAPIRVINCAAVTVNGVSFVFATVVNDRSPVGLVPAPGAISNFVSVLRLSMNGPAVGLQEVARWTPEKASSGDTLTHDLAIETHPLTGQRILYVAGWDSGAWLVDVTDPLAPKTLSHYAAPDIAQGAHTHTVKPHPGLVGGKHLTLVSPETFVGAPSGSYRLLDTTDPARPMELAAWSLPGNLTNPENLLWSPHEFTLHDGRAFTSNYHGGTWVLDLAGGLRPVAAWARAPDAWTPTNAAKWAVDAETAVWHQGRIFVADMGEGLVVLEEA